MVYGSKQNHVYWCTSMEIPKNNEDYRKLDYWDKRYKEEDSYDWFTGYESFKDLLVQDISKSDLILNLGRPMLLYFTLLYFIL